MRVVVPVKYVPDIQSDRRFGEDGRVVRVAAEGTLNELDEVAVECALRLVESLDEAERASSEVVAVTVGPVEADLALRKAFQLGVHRGLRLTDDALIGSDYFATASALAAMVRLIGSQSVAAGAGDVDVVITGMAALDGLGSVVPALLAAELDWPQLLLARSLDVADGVARIERELDGASEDLQAPLPAVISVTDHIAAPRYPNFASIVAARTKPIEVVNAADVGVLDNHVGALAARTAVLSAVARPPREPVVVYVDDGNGGNALVDFLVSRGLA